MKVAVIVQRYGREIVGGSETLARQYAHGLRGLAEVEVLTTCARDHLTWRNHFPEGASDCEGVTVRRFATDFERGSYWGQLARLLEGPANPRAFPGSPLLKQAHARRLAAWPRALQEEIIRRQGPYSSALLGYLAGQARAYDAFLFCAYLFPTTYFGMQRVPPERIVFCPTLHDEALAYLPIFRRVFQRPRFTVFLTEAERALAQRLYGAAGESAVIGLPIAAPPVVGPLPKGTPPNYVLYSGRIEESKGTGTLCEYFLAYKQRRPSDLKLVLIGTAAAPLPPHPDLVYLGFVPEAEKLALMKGAKVFVHPSPYESFAIVLLESFWMGIPALVNRHNEVLLEHCRHSGAGFGFAGREEFGHKLEHLLADAALRQEMGSGGRRYVAERYPADVVARALGTVLRDLARAGCRPPSPVRAVPVPGGCP